MPDGPLDIFTEPDADPDTLRNLGPLAPLAGSWLGDGGLDVHPTADGPVQSGFVERYDLEPIDPQTNGPQLFYGLRYHTRITQPGETAMFHDQVGYWLWEPASIITNPFLEYAFQTTAFEMTVTINDDGSWAYDQTTTLNVRGETQPFFHTDRNTLKRIAAAVPNPLAGPPEFDDGRT